MECFQSYFIHNQQLKLCAEFNEDLYLSGKSVYEVIRIEQGIALFAEDHLERMFNSASILGLSLFITKKELLSSIRKLIVENKVSTGKIKILVNFNPVTNVQTDFLIYFNPHYFPTVEEYKNGVKTGLCKAVRDNPNAKLLNSIARLKANQVIAETKLFEVILLDNNNCITEGSRSNLLFIKRNSVYSAPEKDILQGIARKNVKRICSQNNIPFIEQEIRLSDVELMEAMCLTGTSLKILPVNSFDQFVFEVDNVLMKKLMVLYDKEIEGYLRNNA